MKSASARSRTKGGESRVDLARGAGIEEKHVQPEGARGFLKRFRRRLGGCNIAWIDQHSEAGRFGQKLMHESEPLDVDFKAKKN
jgi:hypothetical protein